MSDQIGAEWPKWVFPEGTPGLGKAVLVCNADEEADAMGSSGDERSELVAQAEALGISVDKRWGLARLKQAIEAAS